jgi:hypothetical protein
MLYPTRQFEEKLDKMTLSLQDLAVRMDKLLNQMEHYIRVRELYFRRTTPTNGATKLSTHQITFAAVVQNYFEIEDAVESIHLYNRGDASGAGGVYYAFERDADATRDMYLPAGGSVTLSIRCQRIYLLPADSQHLPTVYCQGMV